MNAPTEPTSCDFCHLPVPGRRRRETESPEPLYCCYGCRLAAQITRARGETGQANWMLTRLGVCAFLSMGVMVFALALYSQDVYHHDPNHAPGMAREFTGVLRYLSLALATPVLLLLGVPILVGAYDSMRQGVFSTDALVVLGVGAAMVYSYASTLAQSGQTYYETACMVLVLMTLGRYLEANGKLRASQSVRALEALFPDEVRLLRDGRETALPVDSIREGDLILVDAGSRIAADGIIEKGRASIDEQWVTGESAAVTRAPGDTVRAGTLSLDGTLHIRATAVGKASTLGRLIDLLEDSKRSKGRHERIADQVATGFVPLTVLLAVVGAYFGWQREGAAEATMTALAVLLIACPCALGIATPMAIWVGAGRAASAGVLFRDGASIEAAARVRAIGFDKTGTLTTGNPTVVAFTASSADPRVEARTLSLAAALARGSSHALARSITRYTGERGIVPAESVETRTVPGRGIAGTVTAGAPSDAPCGGQTVACLGSIAMFNDGAAAGDGPVARAIERAMAEGRSITCVGRDGHIEGVFAFDETLRPEAARTIAVLESRGYALAILTGDHPRRAESVGAALGVIPLAGLLPEDKVSALRELRSRSGPVAMVGDGLNDAPALALADVGIAMGCGADLTRETADVCLLGSDLRLVPWVLDLSRRTVRTIRQNLFWAFAYNTVGIALAMSGRLSPILAAGAMVVSSLLVVGNSMRLSHMPSVERAPAPAREADPCTTAGT